MEQWKNAISEGNKAYDEGRNNEAQHHYQLACQRAEQLLPHWFDIEAVIAALVVSYQNLAELHFRQSHPTDALSTYRTLYEQLRSFSVANSHNDTQQVIIQRTMQHIGTELSAILKILNLQDPEATKLLDEIKLFSIHPSNQLKKVSYQ